MRWAFNPIALAHFALGDEKGRPWPDSWAAVEALFGAAYKSDSDTVFYGSGDMPALLDLLDHAADQVPKEISLQSARAIPAVRALEDRLANPEWLPRLLALIVPIENVDFTPPGAEGFPTNEHPRIGSYQEIGAMEVKGISWADPEQGCTADCYLISSMIAIAWTRPKMWRKKLDEAAQDKETLTIRFQASQSGGSKPKPVLLPPRVPRGPGGGWIYARSADKGETWPALIERAFVMLQCQEAGEPTVSDYRSIGDADKRLFPHEAARMLIGGSPVARRAGAAVKPFPFVVERCDQMLTTSPTMAWTWDKDDPHAKDVDWKASKMIAGHAYAVLGLMESNGHNFVVLRNPYGFNPPIPGAPRSDWAAGAARNGGVSVSLDKESGVFALSEETFNECFHGVGGVELPEDG